jgi:hypothetical protein
MASLPKGYKPPRDLLGDIPLNDEDDTNGCPYCGQDWPAKPNEEAKEAEHAERE